MSKTAVIYWSGTGNTETMAQAVAEGAKSVNPDTAYFSVSEISADDASSYDTLILGCPAMGSEVLEEDEFEPFFTGIESMLSGKKIALFGSYDWGDGEWMRTWADRCTAAGAEIVGGEGLIVNLTPSDEDLAKCKALGEDLAK